MEFTFLEANRFYLEEEHLLCDFLWNPNAHIELKDLGVKLTFPLPRSFQFGSSGLGILHID